MNSRHTASFAGLAIALGLASMSVAQTATDPGPLSILRAAAEAARIGEAQGDAWTLALAARLRRSVAVTPVDRRPDGREADRTATTDPSLAWIARARSLGRFDTSLKVFLDEVEAAVFRGRRGGPRVSTADLAPSAAHRYVEAFQAGSPAAVYVEGDGDTDLGLKVIDAQGAEACAQIGPGDIKLCSWTPRATGQYTIQVTNPGPVKNRYALATN